MSKFQDLQTKFSEGKVSRRQFLQKAALLGVTTAVSPALWTKLAKASAPIAGGKFRMGLSGGSVSDTLDPAVVEDVMAINVNWQLRNCLTEVDHAGNLIPELAESWESTPDAAQWIFKLRRGVEFHNGKTLVAEDVVDSINYHRGAESKSRAKSIVNPIKEIKADDKHTVIFTLEEGNADFPFIMSDVHLTIQPTGTRGKAFDLGIGTGGYRLQEWQPSIKALVKKNPNYWKAGRAHFDEIETLGIADVNSRTSALKTRRIDVMNRCDLKTVHLMEKIPGIKVLKYDGTKHYTFPMRTDLAPFNNNDLRTALKYAIDREHLVKAILRGYGSVGNDHPIASMNKYYAKELPQRTYDPDKAKYHLKKAGLQDQIFPLHAADTAFTGAVDAAVLYKEYAAKAGINIKVVREPNDGYWSNVWKKVPWCACYWTSRPTADWMFSMAYAEDSKQNDTFFRHARFNQLLKAARAELDNAKRLEMYVEMQRIIRDEGGVVVPMFANHVEAISSKMGFKDLAGNWELDGHRCSERWWFA